MDCSVLVAMVEVYGATVGMVLTEVVVTTEHSRSVWMAGWEGDGVEKVLAVGGCEGAFMLPFPISDRGVTLKTGFTVLKSLTGTIVFVGNSRLKDRLDQRSLF